MVPLDRAMTSSNRLSIVTNHVALCSGLAAIFNAELQPASIVSVRRLFTARCANGAVSKQLAARRCHDSWASCSYVYILQSSVVMQLGCGGMFNHHFFANVRHNMQVKEF